ncbi:MAG: glycosyltransferase family 4 protein [Syntrophobacteraceae bacterium]
MRILLAQDTYLPKLGGAELHVFNLAKFLSRMGHGVTVVTPCMDGSPSFEIDKTGFRIIRMQSFPSSQSIVYSPLFYLKSLPQVMRLVAETDVVHGHYTYIYSAAFGLAARMLGKTNCVTLHGRGTLDSSASKVPRRILRWLSLKLAHRVIATSTEMSSIALRFVPLDRIQIIPNGVDVDHFRLNGNRPQRGKVIMAVRRLVPKNGIQYLIEAMPFILERIPDAELKLIGTGDLHHYLHQRVLELGIADHVRFLGAVSNDRIPGLLSEADVMVFPSSAESTSLAALEAMAAGVPVVASAVGAYPELVGDNERGTLVELFDRKESDYDAPLEISSERYKMLANAVLDLMNNSERSHEVSQRAYDYVTRLHSWQHICDRLVKICYSNRMKLELPSVK